MFRNFVLLKNFGVNFEILLSSFAFFLGIISISLGYQRIRKLVSNVSYHSDEFSTELQKFSTFQPIQNLVSDKMRSTVALILLFAIFSVAMGYFVQKRGKFFKLTKMKF